jgi:Ca2+-binding EF-hand superfamily protein
MVKRLDTSGNGYVTLDEFTAAAQQRFARLDKNGDGKLTPDEFTVHGWGRGGEGQGNAQASGKFAQAAQQRFDKLDANHDGVVTADEYVAAAKLLYAQFDTSITARSRRRIAASPRPRSARCTLTDRLIRRMDTNGDGVVSRDEFMAAAKTRFTRDRQEWRRLHRRRRMTGERWAGKGSQEPGLKPGISCCTHGPRTRPFSTAMDGGLSRPSMASSAGLLPGGMPKCRSIFGWRLDGPTHRKRRAFSGRRHGWRPLSASWPPWRGLLPGGHAGNAGAISGARPVDLRSGARTR